MKDAIARFRIWLLRRREAHALSRAESAERLYRYHSNVACDFEIAQQAWVAEAKEASARIIDITQARLICAITEKRRHDALRAAEAAHARTMRAVGVQ